MNQSSISHKKDIAAGLGTLAVILLIVLAINLTSPKKTQTSPVAKSETTSKTSQQPSSPATSSSSASSVSYKDGSYSAKGEYESPGGEEGLLVKLTLKSDVVTASSAKSEAGDPEAQIYQQQFINNYKKLVVGKSIDNIKISRVAGSSLTSEGFNDALSQIKQQAKA
jgi:hypothetical protein